MACASIVDHKSRNKDYIGYVGLVGSKPIKAQKA